MDRRWSVACRLAVRVFPAGHRAFRLVAIVSPEHSCRGNSLHVSGYVRTAVRRGVLAEIPRPAGM